MLIGEYNEKAEPIKEYLYLNSTPIAILADNKTFKIYSDHLDTPRRVADNSTNIIIWSWNSKPFGDTLADEDVDSDNQKFMMNLRFPGQYFDRESGTHYNINRDYNPLIGRYIQSDPIGFDGGVSTFVYVKGNPLLNVDLEGLVDMNFIPNYNVYNQGSFWLDAYKNYIANPSLYSAGEAFNHDSLFTVLAHGEAGMLYDNNGNEVTQSLLDNIAKREKQSGKNAIAINKYIYFPRTHGLRGYAYENNKNKNTLKLKTNSCGDSSSKVRG